MIFNKSSATKTLSGLVSVSLAIALSAIGCRTRSPQSRVRDANQDAQRAQAIEVLNLIGAKSPNLPEGSTGYCAGACHAAATWHGQNLNRNHQDLIREWAEGTKLTSKCLTDNANDPGKRVACFFMDPNNPLIGYNVQKLGFYRGAAHLDFMKSIFMAANMPAGIGGAAEYQKWLEAASMPKQENPGQQPSPYPLLTEDQFRKIESWSLAGAPELDAAFGPVNIIPEPQVANCANEISDELKQRITQIKADKKSWTEVNKQNPNIKMLGCAPGTTSPERCFMDAVNDQKYPEVHTDDETKNWASRVRNEALNNIDIDENMPPTQRMRLLKKLPFRSTYWARSSADGRFMADGLTTQAQITNSDGSTSHYIPDESHGFIVDLALPDRPYIGVSAPYDPGFFPDNNGFTWMQGANGYFCGQKILEDPATKSIDLPTETAFCGSRQMGVYQHVGRAINDKYYIVRSDNYANDNGGQTGFRTDPSTTNFAKEQSKAQLFTMVEEGTKFAVKDPIFLPTPFEGDFGISPSASFITSRISTKEAVNGDFQQAGYRIRSFDFDHADTKVLGTVCMRGGKASISYDERFLVTHHYVTKNDSKEFGLNKDSDEFKKRIENSSNIYIFDLLTNRKFRVTYMGPGQYALFPHFRSDGWLYFLVRDMNKATSDYAIATDAALRLPTLEPSYTGIR